MFRGTDSKKAMGHSDVVTDLEWASKPLYVYDDVEGGSLFFILLELALKIPRLRCVELLRDAYEINRVGVRTHWDKWFDDLLIQRDGEAMRMQSIARHAAPELFDPRWITFSVVPSDAPPKIRPLRTCQSAVSTRGRFRSESTALDSNKQFRFTGPLLFLLFELAVKLPRLRDIGFLRKVYNATEKVTDDGAGDWLAKCHRDIKKEKTVQLLSFAFLVLPELAKTRCLRYSYPLVDLLDRRHETTAWVVRERIPFHLLDQLHQLYPSAVHQSGFNDFRGRNVLYRVIDGYKSLFNDDAITLWLINKCPSLVTDAQNHGPLLVRAVEQSASFKVIEKLLQVLTNDVTDWTEQVNRAFEVANRNEVDVQILKVLWLHCDRSFINTIKINFLLCDRQIGSCDLWLNTSDCSLETVVLKNLTGADVVHTTSKVVKSIRNLETLALTLHHVRALDLAELPLHRNKRMKNFSLQGENRTSIFFNNRTTALLSCLTLKQVEFGPSCLRRMASSLKGLSLNGCHVLHPKGSEKYDCLDALTQGLQANENLESFTFHRIKFDGDYHDDNVDALVEALATRRKLMEVNLTCSEIPERVLHNDESNTFCFGLRSWHLSQFGCMEKLMTLAIDQLKPDFLCSLLEARPRNLKVLRAFHGVNYASKEDYGALLRFLAWPECKLQELSFGRDRCQELELLFVGTVCPPDETEAMSPGSALIRVLRNRNTSLMRRIYIGGTKPSEGDHIRFWCGMNRVCSNRLRLRDPRTNLGLAVELARASAIHNHGHSIIFDLLQTTQHLWLR